MELGVSRIINTYPRAFRYSAGIRECLRSSYDISFEFAICNDDLNYVWRIEINDSNIVRMFVTASFHGSTDALRMYLIGAIPPIGD